MTQLILDLDTGIDDAMALAFACAWEEIELSGVTATYGNIDVERAAQNTLNLLDLFGENHIPVFRGAVDFILEACDEYQENLTLAGQKLADIVDSYIKAYQKDDPERKGCALHDPLAVAVAVQVQVEEFTQLFSETNLTFLRNCL